MPGKPQPTANLQARPRLTPARSFRDDINTETSAPSMRTKATKRADVPRPIPKARAPTGLTRNTGDSPTSNALCREVAWPQWQRTTCPLPSQRPARAVGGNEDKGLRLGCLT